MIEKCIPISLSGLSSLSESVSVNLAPVLVSFCCSSFSWYLKKWLWLSHHNLKKSFICEDFNSG